ncbi:hypothetical protein F8388_012916 [Cannabis sativa]|uniref:Protein TAPETUM DETERMINANT 1 n=1 Tax=Cannabis sativa TaxID=3483 RepID=A0A7J6ET18_CANSA|nr:hypothetical protein F8388_012916 [Cannabis sativa]
MLMIIFCNHGTHSGSTMSLLEGFFLSFLTFPFLFTSSLIILISFCLLFTESSLHSFLDDNNQTTAKEFEQAHSNHRKLLVQGSCTSRDISISQSRDTTPGIPQFIVQIVNTCVCGCAPSNIHLHCGWFASARIISPMMFKRLSYDDCLVNGGKPLKNSQIIRFTYSNSFMYPLSLRSVKLC